VDPKSLIAVYSRGRTYLYKRDLDKALADFDKALQLDPKFVSGYVGRGDVYAEKGDHDKAFAEFNKAIEIDPKHPEAYQARGDAWMEKEEYERAIADFSIVLRLNPQDVRAHITRGEAHSEKGEYEKALADFEKALKLHANNTDAMAGLAWVRATCPKAELRDGKKALEYAEKACKLTEYKEVTYLDTLAAAYAENGQFDKAVEWQTKALKSPDDFPKKELAKARQRLKLYQDGKPYRKE
jgi:tetratricopeptide (TPR) repeat protein